MKIASKKALVLKKSHEQLDKFLKDKSEALPKDFNETRFLQNAMTVLNETKGIEKMTPTSVARTMLKGAFLGLDFFMGECYAIPYGNKLTFITDYKGEIKLAKLYSSNPIQDIYAKLVREGDEFKEKIVNGKQVVEFDPISFNDGEIIGAFAVCLYTDGSMIYETMSKKEIEGIRKNFSKMPNSMMWKDTPGEAYKKTVLKRLCKMIDLNFDSHEQAKAFDDSSDVEFKDDKKKPEKSPYDAIDVDYEDIDEDEESGQAEDNDFGDEAEEALKE